MSDHSDSPNPPTDITDLYVFQKPGDPGRSVLIMNVNPDVRSQAEGFDPSASYEWKVDTDGDLRADIAYHAIFSVANGGQQTADVYRASGTAAEKSGSIGQRVIRDAPVSHDGRARMSAQGAHRFYAGMRSDPWFADVGGFQDNFRFVGRDTFAQRNVLSIVLELANEAIGPGHEVGIWAQTVITARDEMAVMDQAGRPLINALFNGTPEDQHSFSSTLPAQQRERYLAKFLAVLQGFGYDESAASALVPELLPDVLRYDSAVAARFPNGRALTDDVLDLRLELITMGRVTTDLVGPHTDLLPDFPYLGPPHAAG